jgi:hypothetical protein
MNICERRPPCVVFVKPLVSVATLRLATELPVNSAASACPPSCMR